MDYAQEERSNECVGAGCNGTGHMEMKEQQGVARDGGVAWSVGSGGSGGEFEDGGG